MSEMQDPNKITLTVGNGRSGITRPLELPRTEWDKWHTLSFQFRQIAGGFDVAEIRTTSAGMIWVKERWYHRLWSWFKGAMA